MKIIPALLLALSVGAQASTPALAPFQGMPHGPKPLRDYRLVYREGLDTISLTPNTPCPDAVRAAILANPQFAGSVDIFTKATVYEDVSAPQDACWVVLRDEKNARFVFLIEADGTRFTVPLDSFDVERK